MTQQVRSQLKSPVRLHNKQDTVISPQVASEWINAALPGYPANRSAVADALYLGIALLLGVDIAIRLLGMGRVFFRNRWNIFDIVLVTGVVAMTVPLLLDPLRWNESAIFQIQKVRLLRSFQYLSSAWLALIRGSQADLPHSGLSQACATK